MAKAAEEANLYRVGHPLAQRLIDRAKALAMPAAADVTFQYTGSGKNIAILQPFIGSSGWLRCARLTMTALEAEDALVFVARSDDGRQLDAAVPAIVRPSRDFGFANGSIDGRR